MFCWFRVGYWYLGVFRCLGIFNRGFRRVGWGVDKFFNLFFGFSVLVIDFIIEIGCFRLCFVVGDCVFVV